VIAKEKAFPNREKLLLVIYEVSLQQKSTLKYEDFAVRAVRDNTLTIHNKIKSG
jgi:hypothetical protein